MPNRPSLLDELGLDPENLQWRHLASCKSMAPRHKENGIEVDLFYEGYENDPELAKAMDEVCLACPVMKECLLDAVERKDSGLRGSIYLVNGTQDKQHNEHKTPEVWERIHRRLR